MLEDGFNRALDRLWAWARWQVGLISEDSAPQTKVGFRPSLATGTLVLVAFAYQVVSGGLLLLYYQPSVYPTLTACGQALGTSSASPAAWCSTYYIVHSVPMGAVLLTSHLYGAYVVIALLLVHLFRGFYVGSYKLPGRKFSWVAGTLLLLLTLAMGFTGYLLAYTQLSYNATQVSITLVQALPGVGPSLADLILGDGTAQGLLSRMFALHVVLLPAAILLLVFLHKRSVLFPRMLVGAVKWGLLYIGTLLAVATLWLWSLPTYAGGTGGAGAVSTPAWFFLWVFKLVDFEGVTPEAVMVFIAVLVVLLLVLPFLDRSPSLRPRDRPVILFLGNTLVGGFVLLTAWGDLEPGVPASAGAVAWRLGPVVVVNALVVAFFHLRSRRLAQASGSSRPEGSEVNADASAKSSVDAQPVAASGPGRLAVTSARLAAAGLVGSLFLVPMGLLVPVLFLFSSFLVQLADEARRPSGSPTGTRPSDSEQWVFPCVGLVAVVGLLVASGAMLLV
ncbi:MAG TPA: cytochrome b N-terminal domain-containing protein [Thermoplasmata archaeon]|nr:cytochrome b N-terminal domain-containing protein [Thermoplasmata archaeon]